MSTSTLDTRDADRALRDVLHRVWGFSDFRPLQREAMDAILAARQRVVLPTGGGKSLCFQAPALVSAGSEPNRPTPDVDGGSRRGLAVVVSPLISLFNALRDVQLRFAGARGVPPYVIVHDATLREMVGLPAENDRRAARGVGAKKASDFGDAFDAIRRFRP